MEYIDVIDAGKFWDASETDILPLPLVAIALGIGRNRMCSVPVGRIMIDKRAYYKKGDILDWALSDEGKILLNELKSRKSKIKRYADIKSKFYDYHYTHDYGSYYRPSSEKGETKRDKYRRLKKEWGMNRGNGIWEQLNNCADNLELERLMILASEYRKEFITLRLGLPRGMKLGWWWFEKDLEIALASRLQSKKDWLIRTININQECLKEYEAICLPSYKHTLSTEIIEIDAQTKNIIKNIKLEIEQLEAELKKLG